MSYIAVYFLALLLPGWALLATSSISWSLRLPLIVMVSYAIFVASVVVAYLLGTNYQQAMYGWVIAVAVSGGLGILRATQFVLRGRPISLFPDVTFNAPTGIFLATVGSVLIYLIWAGPYLELPSDSWWHLGRMQDQLEAIDQGHTFGRLGLTQYLHKERGYWYLLHAALTWLAGYDIQRSIAYVSTLNPLILLISVYGFALFIFNRMNLSNVQLHLVACFSVVFFIMHFGISAFAYIRYYAFAPAMLSYAIYLGMTGVFLSWLEGNVKGGTMLALVILSVFVLTAVHKQEMMYFLIAASALIAYLFVLQYRERSSPVSRRGSYVSEYYSHRKIVVLFLVLISVYLLVHVYLYVSVDRKSALRLARIIDVNSFAPFLKNLYILDPTKNFYATVTIWGAFIYLLYLIKWKSFKNNIYITSMMLVPFITVFNPVFVDLFLRVSWPELLWRITYMLPLSFLGAYFLVFYLHRITESTGLLRRMYAMVPILLLFVLLFPIQSRFVEAHEVRFPSLMKQAETNDYRNWSDLVAYLKTQPKKSVITDRITGYMINGLTSHVHHSYKFSRHHALPLNSTQYHRSNFETRTGWWLIINMREGALSSTGRISGHWPEDVLQLKNEYSVEFLTFVEENKDLFKPVWAAPEIRIFEVTKG